MAANSRGTGGGTVRRARAFTPGDIQEGIGDVRPNTPDALANGCRRGPCRQNNIYITSRISGLDFFVIVEFTPHVPVFFSA